VNPETIDSEYGKLQQDVQSTAQAIEAFSQKLKTASDGGDANAKDWLLDLKSIALQVQQDQLQMQALMQALHDFTVSQLSDQPTGTAAPTQPAYAPQPAYTMQQPAAGAGGAMGRFMGGGFGRAIATGAAFGLGSDLINRII